MTKDVKSRKPFKKGVTKTNLNVKCNECEGTVEDCPYVTQKILGDMDTTFCNKHLHVLRFSKV